MTNPSTPDIEMEEVDATLELADQRARAPHFFMWLGMLASEFLKRDGIVTLFIKDERENQHTPPHKRRRFVAVAPVTSIMLMPDALTDTDGYRVAKWVRPILTSGRPQFVAQRDGQWWEVELEPEFEKEEDHEEG